MALLQTCALCKISVVSCQIGPICHALTWRVGPFLQDTIDICDAISYQKNAQATNSDIYLKRMSIYTIWEISPLNTRMPMAVAWLSEVYRSYAPLLQLTHLCVLRTAFVHNGHYHMKETISMIRTRFSRVVSHNTVRSNQCWRMAGLHA